MPTSARKNLEEYLALEYPFTVIADPDGGFVVVFPDLPGCMTQAETCEEIGAMANEARQLWLESAFYQADFDIPLPSYPEEHSGKFNLRLPKTLHRRLAEAAEREGVSLNSYVVGVLSRREPLAQIERRLGTIEATLERVQETLRYQPANVPTPKRERFQVVHEGYEDSVAA